MSDKEKQESSNKAKVL